MPMKCVVVRLHIGPVGPNTCPGKVAQHVRDILEGKVVPGMRVTSAEGWNCPNPEDQYPALDWWTEVLKGVAPKSPQAP